MVDSKLLDIAEDIKNLSTSGNKIQVEEYKNGKKVEKEQRQRERQRQLDRVGRDKKKKLPIVVIDVLPKIIKSNGYNIILTKPKKKNKNYSNQ